MSIVIDLSQLVTAEAKRQAAAERSRAAGRTEALRHLAETDWLIVRRAETARPVPHTILESRARARAALSVD